MGPKIQVYNISTARPLLPVLVKRARQQHEEIHIGAKGIDEVTLIASDELRELKELARIGQQALAGQLLASDPWAGVKEAIQAGRLTATGAFARAYHAHANERETHSWPEMAASGMAATATPEFRRPFLDDADHDAG